MGDNSRFFFVLTAIGAAVGIGSRWAFPFYLHIFGAWFYLAYFTALVLLGIPLLMTEFSFSQYKEKNIVDSYFSISRFAGSIGWFMVFNAFMLMSIYAVRLGWHIIYIFVSFGTQWKGRAESYFFNNVLQVSGADDFAKLSLTVFLSLILAWLAVYPLIRKGFESLKNSYVYLLTAGSFLMIAFFLYSLTLEKSLAGVYSLFHGSFSVFSMEMWIAAFSLAAVSLGASFGIMHAISRNAKGFMVRSASMAVLFELLVSIALGFILFSILGFMAFEQGTGLNGALFSEYSSTFTVLSEGFTHMASPSLLSFLFFLFLGIFFLIGTSSLAFSVVSLLSQKLKTSERNAAVIVCGFGFIFGLAYAIKPGYYAMELMSHYIYYNILIALLFSAIAIFWISKAGGRISKFIDNLSFIKAGKLWHMIMKYFTPVILAVLIVYQIAADWHGFKNYPSWAVLVFGIGTVAVPAAAAFMMPKDMISKR